MQELLSVIVPVYNVQNYLRRCVKSIINQTYKTVEVILVDDGSTDLSGVICDKLCEEDDRIRVIHKKNEGSICARYEGILQARSKYITFVDGDDWIKRDMYESLMKIATEKNVDMITSGYIIYWAKDDWKESKDDTFAPGEYTKQMIEEKVIPRMMWDEKCKNWPISSAVWNKIFKRDILLKIYEGLKSYRFHFADDAAVVYPYILEIESIYITHECYYFYRQRKKGTVAPYITGDHFFEELYNFFVYLKTLFEKHKNKEVLIKQLEYFYMTTVEMRKQKYHDRRQKGYVHLFPFNKVEKDSSIIIYGAGRVGHEYFDQIDQLGYCEIVLWVDKNYLNYQKEDICDISMIFEVEYDYIVIANASINVIRQIIQEMINLGISEKKIIY